MAKDNSFDIVSQFDNQEIDNAVNQAIKEIDNRFDFKNSKSKIDWDGGGKITLVSDDEFKLKNVADILEAKMVKRNISLKTLKYGKVESSLGDKVRQLITLQQGIDKEMAKKINTIIKNSKLKVQSQIQGDQIRVTGKSLDDLQSVMQMLKNEELDVPLQFINYR